MSRVAALEVGSQGPALDGLSEDDGGLALGFSRCPVGRVELAVVVPAALKGPDVFVGKTRYESRGARIATKEILADVGAVFGFVRLEVTVGCGVHDVDERTLAILCQQRIPIATPHHLENVPTRSAEHRLELLNDLPAAADGAVKPLQIAVDHEREVVETLSGREADGAKALDLVHLAVA